MLQAQQPLNLNFEQKSVEGIHRPWGWDPKTWGPVSFRMDSQSVKQGTFSLASACDKDNNACALQSLRLLIEAYELRGKKLRISGFIKTTELTGAASISIGYTYRDGEGYAEADTASVIVSGTTEWKNVQAALHIPSNAQTVYVLVHHSGKGKAWFDDLQLFVEGQQVSTVKVARPFDLKDIKWIGKNISMVQSVQPLSTGEVNSKDLWSFKKSVAQSRIVALGEATHGTSEFFTLKHRLLQYAVITLGFRVFAIEDNQLAVEKVNRYVHHEGSGTAKESMSGLFAVWYTKEVLAMVEWVRDYNEIHSNDPVSFVGFDMQEIARPADSLLAFLKRHDESLYRKAVDELSELKLKGPESYSIADSVKLKWFRSAQEIYQQVLAASDRWTSMGTTDHSVNEIMFGIQYANLVRQYAENIHKGMWSLYRDEAMAENIAWLAQTRYKGQKIIVWAHDVHVSRAEHPNKDVNLNNSKSMGLFLSKRFGKEYKSFSLSTYEGAYLALKSYMDFTKVHAPLFPSPEGSLDEVLHRLSVLKNTPAFYLPLPRTRPGLVQPAPKRFANHVSIDYGFWEQVSLPYQFDGVFFIDKTSPAVYLGK